MIDIEKIKQEIVISLRPLNPLKNYSFWVLCIWNTYGRQWLRYLCHWRYIWFKSQRKIKNS